MHPAVNISGVSTGLPSSWWIGENLNDCLPVFPGQASASPLYPFDSDDLKTPFRSFGWIKLRRTMAGTHVAFDLHRANPHGLSEICDYLAFSGGNQVFLQFFWSGAWARETIDDGRSAADRLSKIQAFRNVFSLQPGMQTPVPLEQARTATRFISAVWGRWDRNPAALLGDPDIAARSSVFAPNLAGRFDMAHVGDRSSLAIVFGRAWARNVKQKDALPDEQYDETVSDPYTSVLNTGVPHLDQVITPIKTWAAIEPRWIGYKRLLVATPPDATNTDGAVLCATSITSTACSPIMFASAA